jgi:hypothetical protein
MSLIKLFVQSSKVWCTWPVHHNPEQHWCLKVFLLYDFIIYSNVRMYGGLVVSPVVLTAKTEIASFGTVWLQHSAGNHS